jgi:hypothetical protein
MKLPWEREAIRPGPVSAKQLEFEAAKEILAEVFHIRPVDVDDMLLMRLETRNSHEEFLEGLWQSTISS